MKILFVTRKFLPDIGGMEIAATQLFRELAKDEELKLVRFRSRKELIPLRLLEIALRSVFYIKTWKPDIVLLQDAVLSLTAPFLSLFHQRIVVITHGLDITYASRLYRKALAFCLRKCNVVVFISEATGEAFKHRFPSLDNETKVIQYSVQDDLYMDGKKKSARSTLEDFLGIELEGRPLLLTVGRLVRRKGVLWFCENCLQSLIEDNPKIIYLVMGDGNMRNEIECKVNELGLSSYVIFTGEVSKRALSVAYNAADLFIMPNISVPSDMEGFGLVALEACSCELPVVAADIEGIREALKDGEGGVLVKSEDANGFIDAIEQLLENEEEAYKWRSKSRSFFLEEYGWEKSTQEYQELFRGLTSNYEWFDAIEHD